MKQKKREGGVVEFVKYFKRGLTSKGKSRLWSGWEAKKRQKESGITHGEGGVIDGQVDTG